MQLLDLPNELLRAVGEVLESERDLSNLVLTCRLFHELLTGHLYRNNIEHHGNSAFLWAVLNGNIGTARRCLSAGADVNEPLIVNIDDATTWFPVQNIALPLCIAAALAHEPLVTFLLVMGADANRRETEPHVRIPEVVRGSTTLNKVFQSLAHRFDDVVFLWFLWGESAFMQAVGGKDPEVVRILLANGADILANTQYDESPLHIAIYGQGGKEVVRILLDGGADITAKDRHGETPLLSACGKRPDDMDFVRMLVDHAVGLKLSCEFFEEHLNLIRPGYYSQAVVQLLHHHAYPDRKYPPFS